MSVDLEEGTEARRHEGTQLPRSICEVLTRCRCGNEVCDAAIPNEFVRSIINPRTGIQTVKAWCQHCNTLWMAKYVLRNGEWAMHEWPIAVSNEKTRMSFRRAIGSALGETQRK
jgi:hypothetical protein